MMFSNFVLTKESLAKLAESGSGCYGHRCGCYGQHCGYYGLLVGLDTDMVESTVNTLTPYYLASSLLENSTLPPILYGWHMPVSSPSSW
eukprot:1177074-Prorocentrum_minimum.AAC.3